MKLFLITIFLLLVKLSFAQQENFEWKKINFIPFGKISCWNVDAFDNLLVTENSTISKYNSNGELLFRVSNKSFGEITQIIPITPFKLIIFSEQQQRICFLDNTLTLAGECIELSELNIEYATKVARSSRGDKLWIFDQINSRILLIDITQKQKIIQEISNAKGLVGIDNIVDLQEFNSQLYVLDEDGGLITFDLFGNKIDHVKTIFFQLCSSENLMWFIADHTLYTLTDDFEFVIFSKLPIDQLKSLRATNTRFYFEQDNGIQSQELVKKN